MSNRTIILAAVLLFLANVADLLTTRVALGLGAVESNPIMADIIEGWGGVALKVGFVGVVAWLATRYVKTAWVGYAFAGVALAYWGVVFWNVSVILYLT